MTHYSGTTIVTGGATGLGAACARAFCEAGAVVTIFDVVDGSHLARELTESTDGSCAFRAVDVSSASDLERSVNEVADQYDGLDCLVNNAAKFLGWRRIDDIGVDEFRELVDVNLVPYFVASKAALPCRDEGLATAALVLRGGLGPV